MECKPLFLLGAGFNADALNESRSFSGDTNTIDRFSPDYPMVPALGALCFGLSVVASGQSIEDLFQRAIDAHNPEPMDKLADELRNADNYIADPLSRSADSTNNCYAHFFREFRDRSYLTFNYDSLVEIFLLRLGRWDPRNGYGVRVQARLAWNCEARSPPNSPSRVLHLHGSLCVKTAEVSRPSIRPNQMGLLEPLPEPEYFFQPGSIQPCFRPFERGRIESTHDAAEWVIAPVRNKASRLSEPFIEEMYQQAVALAREQSPLVVIGYSFNAHDRTSFDPILDAAGKGAAQVVVVSPDATLTVGNLRGLYPAIDFRPIPTGFAEWVSRDYPGLGGRPE